MHHCIKFILFWNDTLHVSDGLSIHHQQFKTVHTATRQQYLTYACCCMYSRELLKMDGKTASKFPVASRQQYLFDICLLLYVQS